MISPVIILRGIAKVFAAASGLLLAYGITFAFEGTTAARELASVFLWTLPWMLLFCSGIEDLTTVLRRNYVLWLGAIAALIFLYYFDWRTTVSSLTKAAMPPLVVGAGLTPHFFRKMRFLYDLASIASGLLGAGILFATLRFFFNPTAHFASKFVGALFATLIVAGIVSGLLSILDVYRRLRPHPIS